MGAWHRGVEILRNLMFEQDLWRLGKEVCQYVIIVLLHICVFIARLV